MLSLIKRVCSSATMDFAPRTPPASCVRHRHSLLLSTSSPSSKVVLSWSWPSKSEKQQQQQQQLYLPALLESLPCEVLAECLSFLTVSDVAAVARVSKKMRSVTQQEVVWRLLCEKYFPACTANLMMETVMNVSWRELFQTASEFGWDKDFSKLDAVNSTRSTPLLRFNSQKNKIVKAVKSQEGAERFNLNLFESATSRSTQSMRTGLHCLEFKVHQHDSDYEFAVGLIDACDTFNFNMASYGDGENSENLPADVLKQCFYWSDGSFSDIMGSCDLSGTLTVDAGVDARLRSGDVVGMIVDMDASHVTFYKNYKRVCKYSFVPATASAVTTTTTVTTTQAQKSEEESEEQVTEMHAGIYMFAEGDAVTVRRAPFYLYE